MTRNEFIQHYVIMTASCPSFFSNPIHTAKEMAEQVSKVAPFDGEEVKENEKEPSLLDKDFSDPIFDLSVRTYNVLKSADINNLRELCRLTRRDVYNLRCCGKRSIEELDTILEKYNLEWGARY